MSFDAYIGIDPGKYGAIAILAGVLTVHDMPLLPKGRVEGRLLASWLSPFSSPLVFLEEVHSMPSDGHVGAFSFGQSFGIVQGVLDALCLNFTLIQPSVWKAILGLTSDKESSRKLAIAQFPDYSHYFQRKKDDGRAEAALLAGLAYDRFPPKES